MDAHMIWDIGHIALCPVVCMIAHKALERRKHKGGKDD